MKVSLWLKKVQNVHSTFRDSVKNKKIKKIHVTGSPETDANRFQCRKALVICHLFAPGLFPHSKEPWWQVTEHPFKVV